MTTLVHTEAHDWPADALPRGEHAAVWQGCYLRFAADDRRVPTVVSLPGSVACTVRVTDETLTITIALGGCMSTYDDYRARLAARRAAGCGAQHALPLDGTDVCPRCGDTLDEWSCIFLRVTVGDDDPGGATYYTPVAQRGRGMP